MNIGFLISLGMMFFSIWWLVTMWNKYEGKGLSIPIIFFFISTISSDFSMLYYTDVIGSREDSEQVENQLAYVYSQGYVLGKHLASKNSVKGRALIIADSDYKYNIFFKKFEEGFKNAAGNNIGILAIDYLDIPGRIFQKKIQPLWSVMRAVDFDILIDKYPECNIVISTVGLPDDAAYMKVWRMPEKYKPSIAVVGSYLFFMGSALDNKQISAAVIEKPVKITADPPPPNPEQAFDSRFLLATPENVKLLRKQYPDMFKIYYKEK